MNLRHTIFALGCALLGTAGLVAPVLAADGGAPLVPNSALVRGGAPLPQFNTGFPI
jgi:hypothetical protein